MNDLISRQAAIDALSCENPTEIYVFYDDAVKAIKKLPAAEPESILLDIVCEIQRKKNAGECHVGDAVDWCIFGRELKNAIYELFGENSQQ